MEQQNYQNHKKLKPELRSHKIYYALAITLFIFSVADLCMAIYRSSGRVTAFLFFLTSLTLIMAYFLFRAFALKAQDRAIRAEENLRYYVLTGKLLSKDLSMLQIIALRFAADEEFVSLTEKALKENLSNDDIKKAVKSWKADHYRA